MNIQIDQLIYVSSYLAIFIIIYKTNKKYIRYPLIALALIMFFVNPLRMTATSIKKIERGVNKFDDMPEKVLIKQQSFDDFNKSEIDKLNELYEEEKDEIHN